MTIKQITQEEFAKLSVFEMCVSDHRFAAINGVVYDITSFDERVHVLRAFDAPDCFNVWDCNPPESDDFSEAWTGTKEEVDAKFLELIGARL